MGSNYSVAEVRRIFAESEVIVSKPDTKDIITYFSEVFLRISDYILEEAFGKQCIISDTLYREIDAFISKIKYVV